MTLARNGSEIAVEVVIEAVPEREERKKTEVPEMFRRPRK
jgi:hypothetical protein